MPGSAPAWSEHAGIHNFKISDPAISGFEQVDVRQGYAKCCTCVVDEGSIITSDAGIAKAAAGTVWTCSGIRPRIY